MSELNYKELAYPEKGKKYWAILDFVVCKIWNGDMTDIYRLDTGNYFSTKKKADLEYEWRLLNTKFLNTIALLNKLDKNWRPDWKNGNKQKWYFVWDEAEAQVDFLGDYEWRHYENNRYMSSRARNKLLKLYTQEQFKFWLTKEK